MRSRVRFAFVLSGISLAATTHVAATPAEDVVVTATRIEQPLDQVGQSLSVIDAAQIQARQSDTVVDLLRTVPGLTVARNGGIGTSTLVFIRGADSDQTVALIDGVKLNDPSAPGGGFNFGNLLTANVDRVEVLRGSQSTLWGSQAIGGVINLITHQPTQVLRGDAHVEYGANDTREIAGSVAQKFGPVAARVGLSRFHTGGISAFNENRGGTERDGYDNLGAQARFDISLTDTLSLDARAWYSKSRTDFDGFPAPSFTLGDTREHSRTRELVSYTALKAAFLDGRFHNRFAFAHTQTQRENFDPDGFVRQTFDGDGRNERFEYQGTFALQESLHATFGAETEKSRFSAASYGGPATKGEARIDSLYVEIVSEPVAGLTTVAGLRRDEHDEFGGATTPSASLAWTPNAGDTLLRASYSEGFKAPTLYQLQSEYGNAQLRPETAKGGDIGITQRLWDRKLEIGATYFRRNSHDLINFISCTTPLTGICAGRPFGTYDNVARARAQGVEAQASWRPIDAFTLVGNYSRIDTENRSPGSANFGNALVRRPRTTASALLDYRFAFGLDAGLTFSHYGASFDNASNTRRVRGHDLVDVRFGWRLTDTVALQARIENVFDERYETIYRYGTLGRAAYVGARFSWGVRGGLGVAR